MAQKKTVNTMNMTEDNFKEDDDSRKFIFSVFGFCTVGFHLDDGA